MKNKIIYGVLSLCLCMVSTDSYSQDVFADIATRAYQERSEMLVEPQAPDIPSRMLPMSSHGISRFKPMKRMNTAKELQEELHRQRAKFKPFLEEWAPSLSLERKRVYLKEFLWKIGDVSNPRILKYALSGQGQDWKPVTVPHYGPPLGRAVTYYYKEIDASQLPAAGELLYLCFKGVDYKTVVYVNGFNVGSHEGFFAPFEFEISRFINKGKNKILIQVENDFATNAGKDNHNNTVVGDKIYAATGPGYDEPQKGWHHCPPAMGIYQTCYLESRPHIHVHDVFVRPMVDKDKVEAWVEVNNLAEYPENIKLKFSVFGLNFNQTLLKDSLYIPQSVYIPGAGDLAKPTDGQVTDLPMGYGSNLLKVLLPLHDYRLWNLDSPWLYQLQVKVLDTNDRIIDEYKQDFGMRAFTMDTVSVPKGRMFLNGRFIRLRGANTMGHLQQCVMKGNTNQLIDDILLAKICNMNYLRLTQRPVQDEIYTICDKLGLMNQADFPLFGALRRNQFAQAVKQTEELEKLVRNHPSTIMVSYINERFPNADGHPQRSFSTRDEYYQVFSAMDAAIKLNNPDRVIKAGDGDYDPPSPGLPDNHCYNGWYNGHGLSLGKMNKGYWLPVKPNWYYACGEFGSEGLDPMNTMSKYYPKSWLPTNGKEEKTWNPSRIPMAQTQNFHYMWYPTPSTLEGWIEESQKHQEWVTKFTTEAFRRDNRMVSFAIHLFIDAWPAGWMKSIMDVDRQPKKAYFAYRDALSPLMVSLRTDRSSFYAGENIKIESWICNDTQREPKKCHLRYQLEDKKRVLFAGWQIAEIRKDSSVFQGYIYLKAPSCNERKKYMLRVQLCDSVGKPLHENTSEISVFPPNRQIHRTIYLCGPEKAESDFDFLNVKKTADMDKADAILVTDYAAFCSDSTRLLESVRQGKNLLFMEMSKGNYSILGRHVEIRPTVMGNYYFVNPRSGHPIMEKYQDYDFKNWYDVTCDYIVPILYSTITAPDFKTMIKTGSTTWAQDEGAMSAVSELKYGNGCIRISQLKLDGMCRFNPVASNILMDLLTQKNKDDE